MRAEGVRWSGEKLTLAMSRFGVLLRRHRTAVGLSQESLAERARMSVEGVSALERGYRQRPQRQTVAALADALALSDAARREFEASAQQSDAEPLAKRSDEVRLPVALSTFIGREHEIAEIAALLRESRLVTIVGSGGVGKTQTALRVAGGLRGSSIFSARFVGLASLDASGSVAGAIASALGVQEQTGSSLERALLAYLRNKNMLLVLDNCEHVVAGAAAAVALLVQCPRLRVLATSRERLKVAGERSYRLPPMRIDEAVLLFADRARGIDHRFTIADENRPVVADICRRVDGIPFAIELAAARVNLLSLRALSSQLDDRLRILTGADRAALPHKQTMRATIDWSFDLLAPQEQRLYAWLSVFSGGCTLEGALAAAPPEASWQEEMLDLLSSLVDKSLLTVDFAGTQPRYRYLESFRAHAYEKLGARGEIAIAAHRHAEASFAVVQKLGRGFEWEPNDIEPELENARSAIDWAIAAGEITLATRITCGFTSIWRASRGDAQPRRWLEALLPRLDDRIEPEVAAQAWRSLGSLRQGEQKIEAAHKAIALATASQNPGERVAGICLLTSGLVDAGRIDEAESADEAMLRICREGELFESRGYATVAQIHAFVAMRRGRFGEARRSYAEALALTLRFGNVLFATSLRHNLAELELLLGNVDQALELATAAADSARRMRFARFEAISLTNVAACSLALGDVGGAREAAHDALELAQGGHPWAAIVAIQHLAMVAALGAVPQRGAVLCGYIDAWYRARGCERDVAEARGYETLMAALRERLSERQITALASEGATLPEEEATLEALGI